MQVPRDALAVLQHREHFALLLGQRPLQRQRRLPGEALSIARSSPRLTTLAGPARPHE